VLLVLGTLLVGALGLEWVARNYEARGLSIRIGPEDHDAVSTTEDGDVEQGLAVDSSAPVSEEQAKARVLAQRGELEPALALFTQAAKGSPNAPSVHADLGYWLLKAEKPDDAVRALEKAALLDPQSALIALNLGAAKRRAGDAAGAEKEFRRALELRESFSEARLALGRLLVKQGAVNEAIELFKLASRTGANDDRAEAFFGLGRAYVQVNRTDDAVRAFDEAVNRAPSSAALRTRIAIAWLATGKKEDAARALEPAARAADLAPDQADPHVALGRARDRTGDAGGAGDSYRRALAIEPDRSFVARRLLRMALDKRNLAEARGYAARLLAALPDDPEHHFLAGLIAGREKRLDDARKHYADAIERAKGNYPEAQFNLGLLEKRAGNLEPAIAAYEEALEARPAYVAVLNNLGLAYVAAGRAADAEASYRKAIAIDAKYAPAWLNLGELYDGAGRTNDAIAAFKSALAARPGYEQAGTKLGQCLERAGKQREALDVYAALTKARPTYAAAWSAMARMREHLGDDAGARAAYEKAIFSDPDNQDYLTALAKLDARVGNLEGARRMYEDLLDRAPANHAVRLSLAEVARLSGDAERCRREAERVLRANPSDERAREQTARCGHALN
jgi:tetratricopeptide (TPR) repeat protein